MEGTETGWGRPAESSPRWRALLDRALLGTRTGEQHPVDRQPPASPEPQEPLLAPNDPLRSPAQQLRRPYEPLRRPQDGARQAPESGPSPAEAPDGWFGGRPGSVSGPAAAPRPGTLPYAAPAQHLAPAPASGQHPVPAQYLAPARHLASAPPLAPVSPPQPSPGRHPGRLPRPGVGPTPGMGVHPIPVVPGSPAHQIEWREAPPASGAADPAVGVLRGMLPMPRVVAFANPKGGVHKTTATVLAAATIGSVRGRGVLAWDDNELRGTLGLRAGSARHARTIRHMVANLAEIESCGGPDLIDALDDYLRHAADGSYDVLAGEESPRFAQRLDHHTVRRVLELLRRTHDVICVDTGNNVESANWQTVLQAADQLVITTVPREDAAFTADWMLDLLHDIGLGQLVENAVTLLSCPMPGPSPLLNDLSRHFATRTRAVAVVPYDPALEAGSSIEYQALQPETKRAWLNATAVMLQPFVH